MRPAGIVGVALSAVLAAGSAAAAEKRLIEVGWDAPDPAYFRANLARMERRPYAGLVLRLNADREGRVFVGAAYPDGAFTSDRADLAATRPTKLVSNFLWMNATTGEGWSWFDDADWAAAERNVRNWAATARAGRLKGVFFDPECYGPCPWAFEDAQGRTFDQAEAQVRQRGAQFVRALQEAHPGVELFTTGLLSWLKGVYADGPDEATARARLRREGYALLPAFVNGLLDGAAADTAIIDGNEPAYYYLHADWFDDDLQLYRDEAQVLVAPERRAAYAAMVTFANGVYTDGLLDLWSTGRFFGHALRDATERNRMYEHNVYHGLRTATEYAWTWNERVDWWRDNARRPVPEGAEAALTRAQRKVAAGQPLGIDTGFIARAERRFDRITEVSGRISAGRDGLGGVRITGAGLSDCQSPPAGADGFPEWWCTVDRGATVTVTPRKPGYAFEPASRTVEVPGYRIDGLDFEGTRRAAGR